MALRKTFLYNNNQSGLQDEIRILPSETVTYGVKALADDEWRLHYKINDTWFAQSSNKGEYSDFGKAQLNGIMLEIITNSSNNISFCVVSGIKI